MQTQNSSQEPGRCFLVVSGNDGMVEYDSHGVCAFLLVL
jgi:hypothetical protein